MNMVKAETPIAPTGAAASGSGEHRLVHRQRTLKRARVILHDRATFDCTIRDMNAGGARLVFGDVVKLPETFRLMNLTADTITPVHLQWQRGMEAGVAFTGPEEPSHKHT
jgi:hypothetical protein